MKSKMLFVIGLIIAILGGTAMVYAMVDVDFDFDKLVEERNYKTHSANYQICNNINIDAKTADVKIYSHESNEIYVNYSEDDYNKFTLSQDETGLTIKQDVDYKGYINFSALNFLLKNQYLTIVLPTTFVGKIDVDVTSGDIKVDKLNIMELDIETRSGDVSISNTNADSLDIDVSSGDVKITNVTAINASADTSSGDVYVRDITIESLKIVVHSGDVTIAKTSTMVVNQITNLSIDTTSGRVKFYDLKCPKINVSVSSGDVTGVIIGNKNDYDIKVSTGSGDSNIKDSTSSKADPYKLNVRTNSGDVNIKFQTSNQ